MPELLWIISYLILTGLIECQSYFRLYLFLYLLAWLNSRATILYLILYLLIWLNARATRLYLILYLLAWLNAKATLDYISSYTYWPD